MNWIQLELNFEKENVNEPKPALPHFDHPQNDNERLLNWQHAYKTGGEIGALEKMYTLGKKIALKYIRVKAQGNRHVAELNEEEKKEKAHNAITYIIARYLKVRGFKITDSFTSYLYLRVQHELFYRRKVDGIVKFVDLDTMGNYI